MLAQCYSHAAEQICDIGISIDMPHRALNYKDEEGINRYLYLHKAPNDLRSRLLGLSIGRPNALSQTS